MDLNSDLYEKVETEEDETSYMTSERENMNNNNHRKRKDYSDDERSGK